MKDLLIFKAIKEYMELCLSELSERSGAFCEGQRYVYVDMLEMLQSQLTKEEQEEIKLDYQVEKRYPLE